MNKAKVYNLQGEVVKEMELDPKVFGVEIKPILIQQVVETLMANKRAPIAHTKGRSEVRGGGKKPWKQKGTGRARHGSIRSPLWRGGGITFGPTSVRNFKKDLNKKVKTKALKMVLSDKLSHDHLLLIEDFKIEQPKTKQLAGILNKLPSKDKSVLIALSKKDENLVLSARNLPKVETEPIQVLNVLDLLKYKYLLSSPEAMEKLSKALLKDK